MADLNKTISQKPRRGLAFLRGVDMTTGTIWKKLLFFAIPILLANILQQLFSTVDTAIIGALDSSTALAAVGSVGSLVSLVTGFFIGISTGAAIVVSRRWGGAACRTGERHTGRSDASKRRKGGADAVHRILIL